MKLQFLVFDLTSIQPIQFLDQAITSQAASSRGIARISIVLITRTQALISPKLFIAVINASMYDSIAPWPSRPNAAVVPRILIGQNINWICMQKRKALPNECKRPLLSEQKKSIERMTSFRWWGECLPCERSWTEHQGGGAWGWGGI